MQWIKYKLEEGGQAPTKGTKDSAAYDLYAPHGGRVYPQDAELVPLQIRVAIPQGYCGILTHRSGQNTKGIIAYGTIDCDYRGIVKVNLMNLGSRVYYYGEGDRIAQLRIVPVPDTVLVEDKEMSLETERGEGGHGSTGR